MPRNHKSIIKKTQDQNVYEASLERIEYLYKRFDKIIVSFSGGKDSTALLQCTLEVARKLNKLPLEVVFVDEEAIPPTTVEYIERVRQNKKEINLVWLCLEFEHRNACSVEQPYWYCWNKEEKHLWTRPLPDGAITEHPRFKKGMDYVIFLKKYYSTRDEGTVCFLTGMRAQESLRRLQIFTGSVSDETWITQKGDNGNIYNAHPIYDWHTNDVWVGVKQFGWDYNKTYDLYNKTVYHNKLLQQRISQPYGEEPLKGLFLYAECFPELWHKMINRVKGVATAWRYGKTELYNFKLRDKPDGMTWKDYMSNTLQLYNKKERELIKAGINKLIREHYNKTNDPIPDADNHPYSGASWRFLCRLALRGDFKQRGARQMMMQGVITINEQKIDVHKLKSLYGK